MLRNMALVGLLLLSAAAHAQAATSLNCTGAGAVYPGQTTPTCQITSDPYPAGFPQPAAVNGCKVYRCTGNACSPTVVLTTFSPTVDGTGASTCKTPLTAFPSGVYTFAATAVDGFGVETAKSAVTVLTNGVFVPLSPPQNLRVLP
jgi:hypothetical protein